MWVINCTHSFWQDFWFQLAHTHTTKREQQEMEQVSKIMNQIALHKSNVIDKLTDYQTKLSQTTQTGLIKREMNDRI